jgi:hypothetical protein
MHAIVGVPRAGETLHICCFYREMQRRKGALIPRRLYPGAPNRSERVAMRTSMRNAPNAAVRQIIAATNRMAMAPDKFIETKALANSDITTSETNSADIVQSAIAMFM